MVDQPPPPPPPPPPVPGVQEQLNALAAAIAQLEQLIAQQSELIIATITWKLMLNL